MSAQPNLANRLARLRADYAARTPEPVRRLMALGDAELAASGLADRALQAGDLAPDFALPAARGGVVRLTRRLRTGPVILAFQRGAWCPYCNATWQAYRALSATIAAAGIGLIAVSGTTPAAGEDAGAPGLDRVADPGRKVARAYRIAFTLPEALRPHYLAQGFAGPGRDAAAWLLPIPATYVIAPSGVIALAFLDTDYRRRLEPAEAFAVALASAARKAA
jgi:peroxiredoxin